DGSQIAFPMTPARDPNQLRIQIANADGTNVHELSNEPGIIYENNPAWSPDGTRLVFQRWTVDVQPGVDNSFNILPLAITQLGSGKTIDAGPALGAEGVQLSWS